MDPQGAGTYPPYQQHRGQHAVHGYITVTGVENARERVSSAMARGWKGWQDQLRVTRAKEIAAGRNGHWSSLYDTETFDGGRITTRFGSVSVSEETRHPGMPTPVLTVKVEVGYADGCWFYYGARAAFGESAIWIELKRCLSAIKAEDTRSVLGTLYQFDESSDMLDPNRVPEGSVPYELTPWNCFSFPESEGEKTE